MVFRLPLNLLFLSLVFASLAVASEALMIVNFRDMKPDAKTESDIKAAITQITQFSQTHKMGIRTGEQFIKKATIYGAKTSFDGLIEASPGWKVGAKVPANYVGFGENKEFFVVSWDAYQGVHPNDSRGDYEKLIAHEIAHLFHVAFLKGDENKMGPVWFYEGFACFVANQYPDAALPKDFISVINSPDRASYKDYVAIFRELHKKYPVRELLERAADKKFNSWVISVLVR